MASKRASRAKTTALEVKIVLAISLALWLSSLPIVPVYAHPDYKIVDEILVVPPGKFVEFSLPVHFHRVVGSFEVVSPADGLVNILLMDNQAFNRYTKGESSSQLYSSGKASKGTLNYLVACCVTPIDWYQGNRQEFYTNYHLVIDNQESSSITIRLRITLIHDGGAVIAYSGEPFVPVEVVGIFAAIGAVMGLYMRRSIRRTTTSMAERRASRKLMIVSIGSVAFFASASVLGLIVAIMGARSYGGSLIDGLVVGTADILGGIPSGLIFFPWLFALLLWTKGFGMTVAMGSRLVGSMGVIYGVVSLLVGSLLALNYGPILLPTLVAGIVGLPQILGGLYLIQRYQSNPYVSSYSGVKTQ